MTEPEFHPPWNNPSHACLACQANPPQCLVERGSVTFDQLENSCSGQIIEVKCPECVRVDNPHTAVRIPRKKKKEQCVSKWFALKTLPVTWTSPPGCMAALSPQTVKDRLASSSSTWLDKRLLINKSSLSSRPFASTVSPSQLLVFDGANASIKQSVFFIHTRFYQDGISDHQICIRRNIFTHWWADQNMSVGAGRIETRARPVHHRWRHECILRVHLSFEKVKEQKMRWFEEKEECFPTGLHRSEESRTIIIDIWSDRTWI